MKHYLGLILVSCSLLLFSFTIHKEEIDDVVVALKSGNANQLSRFFDSRVDITLPDRSDNYSRTQAEMVLRDFFGSNTVQNFDIRHKGETTGSKYCIGTLHTRNGDYRTKLLMKQKDDKLVLQEIEFSKN
ncbi:MAG: DUF4783 domain-containing protein [Gemmatimonadaceae bacterium]|nr:DUF4783 domain-containing protein [Chitinophagaceae bacterium]